VRASAGRKKTWALAPPRLRRGAFSEKRQGPGAAGRRGDEMSARLVRAGLSGSVSAARAGLSRRGPERAGRAAASDIAAGERDDPKIHECIAKPLPCREHAIAEPEECGPRGARGAGTQRLAREGGDSGRAGDVRTDCAHGLFAGCASCRPRLALRTRF